MNEFSERFLRRKTVCEITSIPPSTLSDYVRNGVFPEPYKLNDKPSSRHGSAVWKWSEVLAWMNSRKKFSEYEGDKNAL